ncbi:hypothetical protein [Herbaspirillum sp. CF444]|uniref:hypothetical protein n=1 Tax=Herbaspirillum sp. CF444 TaxID=1144319 RepID=UPI0012FC433A|nr:hypothetical protein [Herbaspirillum sp. CF444]
MNIIPGMGSSTLDGFSYKKSEKTRIARPRTSARGRRMQGSCSGKGGENAVILLLDE